MALTVYRWVIFHHPKKDGDDVQEQGGEAVMSVMLIVLVNASIFSIGGIGEDMSVFRLPFTNVTQRTRIEFILRPQFTILNEDNDIRSIFWTHPFNLNFSIPVTKGFVFGLGNLERFNQSFDVYYDQNELKMHVKGRGGLEEIYANLSNNFGSGEIALRGSYLFGNASEVWNYTIGEYSLTDSFLYDSQGKIFCAGIRIQFVSLSYEFLGDIVMEKQESDTTVDLPSRMSILLNPELFGGKVNVLLERSFWPNNDHYRSPDRFKVSFTRGGRTLGYWFNPWYLKNVTEHGLDFSFTIPIHRLGSITLDLGCSLRNKGALREINVIPQIRLTMQEFFARRK